MVGQEIPWPTDKINLYLPFICTIKTTFLVYLSIDHYTSKMILHPLTNQFKKSVKQMFWYLICVCNAVCYLKWIKTKMICMNQSCILKLVRCLAGLSDSEWWTEPCLSGAGSQTLRFHHQSLQTQQWVVSYQSDCYLHLFVFSVHLHPCVHPSAISWLLRVSQMSLTTCIAFYGPISLMYLEQ